MGGVPMSLVEKYEAHHYPAFSLIWQEKTFRQPENRGFRLPLFHNKSINYNISEYRNCIWEQAGRGYARFVPNSN